MPPSIIDRLETFQKGTAVIRRISADLFWIVLRLLGIIGLLSGLFAVHVG